MQTRTRHDDIKLCNCAGCGRELLGVTNSERDQKRFAFRYQRMAGRVFDRPYCIQCVDEQVKREGVF